MLKEILEDLQFIANIPKNAKPNFSDKSFTSTNEWFSTIKRRYKYERGEKGVLYIETLIGNISKIYKTLDKVSLKKIKESLFKANLGLNNIIYTYRIDDQIKVSKDYEHSTEKICKLITDIENMISPPSFFTHCPNIKNLQIPIDRGLPS